MMKKKLSVLIPDGESKFTLAVFRTLSRVDDLEIHILSNQPNLPIRYSRFCCSFTTYEPGSDAVKAILNAIQIVKADVLLPIDVPMIRLVSSHQDTFASLISLPPLSPPETIDLAGDKGQLAKLMQAHDIPHPATVFCNEVAAEERNFSHLEYPVLLKPTIGAGGEGIILCKDFSELSQNLKAVSKPETYIVQSFVNGYDLDCSVLCENGEILAYTIQKGIIPPAQPFAPSSGIEFLYNEKLYTAVQQLMRALNWSGPAHIDTRYNPEKDVVKIIEINPRFWESIIGSAIAGVNIPYLASLAAMKRTLPQADYKFKQYMRFKMWFKLLKQGLFDKSVSVPSLFESTITRYIIQDPLPELYRKFSKIFTRSSSKN
ncbi:MAG TPA: hypothetical protein DDY18_01650 [Flavobacterium sp.]|nr:hypothetical protein [Flavobacterium sp.]